MDRIGMKQLVSGEVILERLAGLRGSKRLRKAREAFAQIHQRYLDTAEEASRCNANIIAAREEVHAADEALDDAVRDLADCLAGARMGSRKNPFASFSPYGPSRITELAYATELRAVRSLLKRISRANPPSQVELAVARCRKEADHVDRSLRAMSVPRSKSEKMTSDLNSIAKRWREAFQRLKIEIAACWVDDPATRAAILAPPEAIQRPVKRKRPKKVAMPALPVATRA